MTFQERIPWGYVAKRLLTFIPTLIGVTLLTFLIFHVVGGDPSYQLSGKNASLDQIKLIRKELGLDLTLTRQYLIFLKQTFTFNWGQSWSTRQNVNEMFLFGIGPSFFLAFPAFIASIFLSVLMGLFAAYIKSKKSWIDQTLTSTCLALMSISLLVYIISFQYYFAFYLGWFEINGWSFDWTQRWSYLTLPWLISLFVSLGPNTLLFRSTFLNEVHQNYVKTARSKGVSQIRIFTSHILKNSSVPIVTIIMMQIPYLLTGSLLLEAFFGIPGIGGLLIQAIQSADFPVIKAFTVMSTFIYLLFHLLTDLLYIFIDPRIELQDDN